MEKNTISDDDTFFRGQLMQAAERIGFNSSNFHLFIFEGAPDKPSIVLLRTLGAAASLAQEAKWRRL
jgi:hypothetical protein